MANEVDYRGATPHPSYQDNSTYLNVASAFTPAGLKASKADIAIIGAPLDAGVMTRPGARFGPSAIRRAGSIGSVLPDLYHGRLGVYPFQVLNVVDFGDADCPPASLELSHEAIRSKVGEALKAGTIPLILGGDHSVTLPCATAVAQHFGMGQIGVFHFDAHADTREVSFGGVRIGHGSPMRRLVEGGAVLGQNFVQFGLRAYYPDQQTAAWMKKNGMKGYQMAEIEERGFDAVLGDAIAEIRKGPKNIYITVDIDVLDPAFAPGTGTPEPGGITSSELLRGVRRVVAELNPVAMDVVEVSPPYDGPGAITAEVAHRVVLEAISAWAWLKAGKKS